MDTRLQMLQKMDRNPVEETEMQNLLRQQGQSGQNAGYSAYSPPIDTARQMLEFQRQANQPAIASYQAQIPEISQRYTGERTRLEGQREPLKQRYQNILADLTAREKKTTEATNLAAAREYGRRGIPLSSGAYEQDLLQRVSPITEQYGIQRKDVGISELESQQGINQLLAQLTGQETAEQRAVKQAIAQLEAGQPSDAISQALQMLQMQNQQGYQSAQQSLMERELGLKEELARRPQQQDQFATLGEGSTLFDLLSGRPLYTAPKTFKPEGGGGDPLGLF